MNNYTLKAIIKDLKETNNKTSFKVLFFELYLNGKLVKKTKSNETKRIMNNLKTYNVKLKKDNDYTITDQKFINNFVAKPISKKGLTGVGAISAVGLVLLTGIYMSKNKEDNYEQPIIPFEQTRDNEEESNELVYEEEIEPSTIDVEYVTPTETNTGESSISEESNEISSYDLDSKNIYSFDYEDRSSDGNPDKVIELYGNTINKYASMYGIDPNLIVAIISQENPNYKKNYSSSGAYGLMQVENIWNNKEITCYNQESDCYETIIIDTSRVNTDADYSIKVGCMILANTAENINKKGLSDSETLQATLIAYNKGITITNNALKNSSSFDEFIDVITSTSGGDNQYREHVFSYLPDDTIIHMNCKGKEYSVGINNTTVKGMIL